MRWLIATHAKGTVDIEDRTGEGRAWSQPTDALPIDDWIHAWAKLHEDLATLERAAGAAAPLIPDDVSHQDADKIAEMAAILRVGGRVLMIRDVRLRFRSDPPEFPIGHIVRDLKQEGTLERRCSVRSFQSRATQP